MTTEHFLAALTDSMAEGVCAIDRDGHVTYMNQAAEKLLGWTKNDLADRPLHDTIHYQHHDGSTYPAADCPLVAALRTARPSASRTTPSPAATGGCFRSPTAQRRSRSTMRSQGMVVVFGDVSARRADASSATSASTRP